MRLQLTYSSGSPAETRDECPSCLNGRLTDRDESSDINWKFIDRDVTTDDSIGWHFIGRDDATDDSVGWHFIGRDVDADDSIGWHFIDRSE